MRAPFKIAFRAWELSLILLVIGCLTTEPGDFFKADLFTRFAFFGLQYVAATAMFAWTTARLFQLSGYPIPFILSYCFLTLLSLPDALIPVVGTLSPSVAASMALCWMVFSLMAFGRAIRQLIPIHKTRLFLIIFFGLVFSSVINLMAQLYAENNGWLDNTSVSSQQ